MRCGFCLTPGNCCLITNGGEGKLFTFRETQATTDFTNDQHQESADHAAIALLLLCPLLTARAAAGAAGVLRRARQRPRPTRQERPRQLHQRCRPDPERELL